MHIDVEQMPELRVATVRHIGPYDRIASAFERLGQVAQQSGLLGTPEKTMLAIYHDNPDTTRADDLRSDAGIVVPRDTTLPRELGEERIPAGRYARVEHIGPYEELGDAWDRFKHEWLPAAGLQPGAGPSFEVYRNTPMDTDREALVTHLYMSVA